MTNKTKKCPVCGKPQSDKYKPFCSKRCSDVDLGKWLNDSYAIQSDEILSDEGEHLTENDNL